MSNLSSFDKEKELYEEINMLKAKVKGYEQLKKHSRKEYQQDRVRQSQSNLGSSLSIHTSPSVQERQGFDRSERKRDDQNNIQEGSPYFKDSQKKYKNYGQGSHVTNNYQVYGSGTSSRYKIK